MNRISTQLPKISNYQALEPIYESDRTLVYRARHEERGQPVIIKLMRNEYPSLSELIQFRNQYVITRALNREIEGIVKTIALERYENCYALIMEDMGGISLAKYENRSSLSLSQFLEIAIQLAGIVHQLHNNSIIHKDIKPANILIHPETKQIKLIDFSISTLLPRETQSLQTPNVLEGTLGYLSPEQTGRMNRGIDYRSDFYSLGVTFYELLTGELPFNKEDPLELIHAHIAERPKPIGDICPQPLADIILKLMAKNAENRYQSALGLKYDLGKCLAQYRETGTIEPFKLGERDICDRFLIPEKLYGRENEVQTLLNAFNRVATGQREMILVTGFSGIGKTAVVNEVHKPIVKNKGYFIKGKCEQFNRNIPFSSFVQAFRSLMGQILSESDAKLADWKTKILEAVGNNGQVLIDVIPELESVIGRQPPIIELSGSAAQNRFNLLLEKFIAVFTQKEHPLTLFLDDLQWADSASLNLIEVLMRDNNRGYLLLVGAYRDNEVFPVHPLMLTLAELKKLCYPASAKSALGSARREQTTSISTITLAPLSVHHINQIVADTLSCHIKQSQPLTELVYQKTQGNPFFTTQFLIGLYEDESIVFNPNLGYWECDLVKVRDAALTSDVVEFIAGRLQKLPEATQRVLKLAACLGNQFDLETLAVVCETSSEEVASKLWSALQEGTILPISEAYKFFQGEIDLTEAEIVTVKYRFLHDRVQQAAYSLIPNDQKSPILLKIGKLLLEKNSNLDNEGSRLFDIVGYLNSGIGLIAEQSQRNELAQLNLMAGEKAKSCTAYLSAFEYFLKGLELLDEDCWQTQYSLTLNLYLEATEVSYLTGNFELMKQYGEIVISRAENVLDTIRVYETWLQGHAARSQFLDGIELGLHYLCLLDIHLPNNPDTSDTIAWLNRVKIELASFSTEELVSFPSMSDPVMLSAMRVLSRLVPLTYFGCPNLFPIVACQGILLSLKYGNTIDTSISYINYALALCNPGVDDIVAGYQYGEVAKQLMESQNSNRPHACVINNFYFHVSFWKEHARNGIPQLINGYQSGLEFGELEFSAYNLANHAILGYVVGERLETVKETCKAASEFVRGIEFEAIAKSIDCARQAIFNLTETTEEPWCLQGTIYDEIQATEFFQNNRNLVGLFFHYLKKLHLSYLFGNLLAAVNCLEEAEKYCAAVGSYLPLTEFVFLASLTSVALAGSMTDREALRMQNRDRIWHLNRAETWLDRLKLWSTHAPMNFQHKVDLVEAEKCRVLGQKLEAIERYDRAIAGAKENKYLQEEALANERAALFYLDWGKETIAIAYLQNAYYGYARWGATAKVRDLEQCYRDLLQPISQPPLPSATLNQTLTQLTAPMLLFHRSTSEAVGSAIDPVPELVAVFKAAQALLGTVQPDEFLHQFTHLMLQYSGGDRCALMAPDREGNWQIEAIATTESIDLTRQPLDGNTTLPVGLIRYVKNTQTGVAIDDSNADLPITDTYLDRHQPQSVLCFPLLNQGRSIGILYLENQLTRCVFSEERLLSLKFLCTQAAISLANIQLYQDLQTSQAQSQRLADSLAELNQTLETQVTQRTASLQANEEQLRLAMQAANQGFFDLNLRTDEAVISPEYARMLGYDPGTFHSSVATWKSQLHPDDSACTHQAYQAYAAGQTDIYKAEFRMRTRQGNWKWILATGQFTEWDDRGKPIRFLGSHMDINDRKRAEIALHNLIEGTAAVMGHDFFPALVHYIAEALNVSYAIVSQLVDGQLQTLAFRAHGALCPNMSYNPAKTPCECTLKQGRFHVPQGVQQQFPEDLDLVQMQAESYFGIALRDSQGNSIGDLCILDPQPIQNPQWAEQILRIFAARASAELERQQAEVILKRQLAAMEAAIDGIGIVQGETFSYVNKAHLELFGCEKPDDLVGKSWKVLYSPQEIERFEREVLPQLQREGAWQGDAIATRKDGSTFEQGVSLTLVDDELLICVCRDISDLKEAQAAIVHNALHDSLTGLPNRALLLDRLELAIARSQRQEIDRYAVLFLDLDRFKVINDSLGHTMGDRLLIAIAQRLQTHVRQVDLVARLGGDEFVILLEDISSTEEVVRVAQRILDDCQTPIVINNQEIFTGMSIGIVLGTSDYHHATDLIRDADIAMYRAKTQQTNSYKFFDVNMHLQALKRLNLETELRKAIERQEFIVFYQPIINLLNHRLEGFEALARWQHPTRGVVSPGEFIPVAEESGLITLIDRQIFHRACAQMVDWQQKFAHCFPLKISINLSVSDLGNPHLIAEIDEIIAQTQLESRFLTLEITESMLIEDIEQTINVLDRLALRHIQISIDDFGTGYSSLNYLHRLPVHNLKIDRSFVSQMQVDDRNNRVVSTIIALSTQLGLTVVAEGIETQQQQRQLQQLGCQLGQGYLFSKPLSAHDIESHFLEKAIDP
ncbi:EAL domain-containing protein [Roseofilum casamattae]|uniref:EAL domain-containing protein n=1 Tax=Roseofilum casamattae BLCC-M143 TaxID=3022442 RepID=A0ABT7BZL3_9CYAN|nr:EAL domain-containing protein [Roseofilum casamattae]MDJ1184653.1 EAL domain-containing protein [Roseofilum casamattae BLCC-M143]